MKIILKKYWIFILLFIFTGCNSNNPKAFPTINIIPIESIGWHTKNECAIIYTNNSKTDSLLGKIKFRGGKSSRYAKNSYTLELDSTYCFDNLPCDDDFIINANYIDKSFIRHKLCYDLFSQMSPDNKAVKSTYVNVDYNYKYNGLYLLMEKINASFLGIDKSDSMAMVFKDPPIFRTNAYNNPDTINIYNQKFPDFTKSSKTDYLNQFKDFLHNSTDQKFAQSINNWIDLKSVIDWHIQLLLTHNGDGVQKNFFLYKKNHNTPFKIAIWDCDHTFGRDGDNEKNNYEELLAIENSILLNRLLKINDTQYRLKLKERWRELRQNSVISNSNINSKINDNYEIIKFEVNKNKVKWPIDEKWYFDHNTIEQEIQYIKKYTEFKIRALDTYFLEL